MKQIEGIFKKYLDYIGSDMAQKVNGELQINKAREIKLDHIYYDPLQRLLNKRGGSKEEAYPKYGAHFPMRKRSHAW